jgi:3-oxoacyl-[acyl-carrier protein] reductase
VLVNNAGLHRGGRVERLDPADFDAVLRASLVGSFLCAARAVPAMKDRGWGRIVQISSPAALRGFAGDAAYGAAKAGQLGMTRCLAVELAPHGITVNAVVPGYVPTEMTSGLSDKSRAAIEASIPLGRPAERRRGSLRHRRDASGRRRHRPVTSRADHAPRRFPQERGRGRRARAGSAG